MRRHKVRVAISVLVVAMAACATNDLSRSEYSVAEEPTGGECTPQGCGENSPVVDSVHVRERYFHELNVKGVPNFQGLVIESTGGVAKIFRGNTSYDLRVHDAHIIGVRGNEVLDGQQLVGARIPISNGKSRFEITIRSVRDLRYFVGASETVGVYTMDVSTDDGNVANVCDNTALLQQLINEQGGERSAYATQQLMGMRVGEAVVFEGDRFDSSAMTTTRDDAVDDDWFNLGCASHTLSKLLLTRNTFHSQRPGIARAWEQRQATLKMQVADYCGGGIPFTVAGQKLVWKGDLVAYISAASELEARWNENGATCLNIPRLVHPTSPLGASTFPDVNLAIRSRCVSPLSPPPPPPCVNLDTTDLGNADRVSANP